MDSWIDSRSPAADIQTSKKYMGQNDEIEPYSMFARQLNAARNALTRHSKIHTSMEYDIYDQYETTQMNNLETMTNPMSGGDSLKPRVASENISKRNSMDGYSQNDEIYREYDNARIQYQSRDNIEYKDQNSDNIQSMAITPRPPSNRRQFSFNFW